MSLSGVWHIYSLSGSFQFSDFFNDTVDRVSAAVSAAISYFGDDAVFGWCFVDLSPR